MRHEEDSSDCIFRLEIFRFFIVSFQSLLGTYTGELNKQADMDYVHDGMLMYLFFAKLCGLIS